MRQSQVYPGDKIQSLVKHLDIGMLYTVTYKGVTHTHTSIVVALPAAKSLRVSISLKQQ